MCREDFGKDAGRYEGRDSETKEEKICKQEQRRDRSDTQ